MTRRAFTLIELVVVMGILGLLVAGAILGLSRQQAQARDARRTSDLANINGALQSYVATRGELIEADGSNDPVPTGVAGHYAQDDCGSKTDHSSYNNAVALNGSTSPGAFLSFLERDGFMQRVPYDPINNFPCGSGSGFGYYYAYYRTPTQVNNYVPSTFSRTHSYYMLGSWFENRLPENISYSAGKQGRYYVQVIPF